MKTILLAFVAVFFSVECVADDLMGTWYSESESTTIALEFGGTDECALSIHHKDIWHSMGWVCSEMILSQHSIAISIDGNSYRFEYDQNCECLTETTGSFLQDKKFLRVTDTSNH